MTAADLDDAALVAALLNQEFTLTSATDEDAFVVVEASNETGRYGVYFFTDANGDGSVAAGELSLIGTVDANVVAISDFVLI